MSNSKEKNRIGEIIPAGIVQMAEPFVIFLKKYYEFMYLDGNPSRVINEGQALRDAQRATKFFLNKLYAEVGSGFYINKENIEQDTANILENLRYIYETKGSGQSIKSLFKVIYGEDVNIYFPSEFILIASDGRWTQDYTVFTTATTGDPFDMDQKILQVNTVGGESFDTEIKRVKRIYSTDTYELYIDKFLSYLIDVGTVISDSDGNSVTVVASTTGGSLYSPGAGFSVGDIFEITEGSGSNLRLKVVSVDGTGAITKIDIISTNTGYTNGKSFMLINDAEVVGGVKYEESTDPAADTITYPNRAIYTIEEGAVVKYPGYYSSNKGFLSDAIFLQDNFFYQKYSYVIQSPIKVEDYQNVLYRSVHPSGMKMFGELNINNIIDLRATVTAVANFFRLLQADSQPTSDIIEILFTKDFNNNVTTSDDVTVSSLYQYAHSVAANESVLLVVNAYYDFGYADPEYVEETIINL